MDEGYRARVPADIDQGEKLIGSFTGRQVAILAVAAAVLWLVYLTTRAFVSLAAFGAAAGPIVVIALVLALGRRDGLPLDRLLVAAIRHRLQPRRLVAAPDGVQPPPGWVHSPAGPLPSPLKLPAQAIGADGVIDLGPDGLAVVVACTTVNFSLATPAEQDAAISAFAAVLHALSVPAQVLVRAERLDLAPFITRLREAAPGLPDPALEAAAREHAAYLAELAGRRDLLHRGVQLVVRDPRGNRIAVTRAAEEAVRGLAACGVNAYVMDGPLAHAVLADACCPDLRPPSPLHAAVEGGR